MIGVTSWPTWLKQAREPSENASVPPHELADLPELSEELLASLLGEFVRADRVAEARGRLRRGEAPADDELARAIVATAKG